MKNYAITDVIRFIFEVERGEIPLTPREDPSEVFAGNVTYDAPGGWVMVVFNDCNSFDYIDGIIDPSGQLWSFPLDSYEGIHVQFFAQYDPPADVIRNVYRIVDPWEKTP
jgi:hypothetical protein